MKTETIKFSEFMSGEWKEKKQTPIEYKIISAAGIGSIAILPKEALAAGAELGSGFDGIYDQIMVLIDGGVVLVIIFAGASWGLGHRGKAIEMLIGCCCGYLLARHAKDIRNFLKGV